MAISGAARQRAYMQRQRAAATGQAAELMVLRQQVKTLRIEVETLRLRLAQSAEENTALKAELSRARQAAPKPPRRSRDLAQYLYPTARRSKQQ